jgi:4-coumarate--CoA ligase
LAQKETVFWSNLPDIDIPNHLPLHDCYFARAAEAADTPCLIVSHPFLRKK